MTGFADTAAYFDAKAKKARTSGDQRRFAGTAGFYRTLARITPTFPHGYTAPRIKPNGSPRADRLRSRAEECRAMAAAIRDVNCRAVLGRLADSYEAMAQGFEKTARQSAGSG